MQRTKSQRPHEKSANIVKQTFEETINDSKDQMKTTKKESK